MTVDRLPHTLSVFLVKPSKYDDDGYVVRHWRGVLPSNTLACLHGLTEAVRRNGALGDVKVEVHLVDEAVAKVPLRAIARANRRPGEKAVVALVGVQTNQFCRASDLARELRREGVAVLLGGFHVSGMMSLFSGISPEIQELIDVGVTIVAGEVEEHWAEILQAAHRGELQPIYRYLDELPDLSDAPRSDRGQRLPPPVRLLEFRHRRHQPRLPLQLLVLHHHQRAGPEEPPSLALTASPRP